MARSIVPIVVILVAIGASLTLLRYMGGSRPHEAAVVKVGQKVEMTLHRFGAPPSESAGLPLSKIGGKLILVNFWASWCEACLVEMPSLVKLRNAYLTQGLEVIPLNVDDNPAAVVPKMADALKINFPIYVDVDQNLSRQFDVHGIPFTVILRPSGEVLFLEAGERDWFSTEVQEQIKSWLNSPSS